MNGSKLLQPHILVASRRHAGTHLINPLVKRLAGCKTVSADKLGVLFVPAPGQKLIVFTRDSRNIATAAFRWKIRQMGLPDVPTKKWDHDIAEKMRRLNGTKNLPPEMHGLHGLRANYIYWHHWLSQPHHRCRFEDLTGKRYKKALVALADYLESDQDPLEIWAGLYKKSHTFSGRFTDWNEWWGTESKQAFVETGGRDLLKLLGYQE